MSIPPISRKKVGVKIPVSGKAAEVAVVGVAVVVSVGVGVKVGVGVEVVVGVGVWASTFGGTDTRQTPRRINVKQKMDRIFLLINNKV